MIVSWNDSAIDPSRAPAGKALMKFVVLSVPYVITAMRPVKFRRALGMKRAEPYADHLIDLITANYIPDLKAKIMKRVVHSPVDMSRKIISAVRGSNLAKARFSPTKAARMRPIPELGQYRTPVPNMYLCSSGSHPGPGVSMAPGRNAAQVIFGDLGLDFTRATLRILKGAPLDFALKNYLQLNLSLLYWIFVAPFTGQFFKIAPIFRQMVFIGVRAAPMVALTAFSVGVTLAMQAAHSLESLGAEMYIPDLVMLTLLREMGPVLIAVIVIGRSGSAVAAELGTMKVSEEIEALEVMAINPVQFLVVPRFLAMMVMLPALTIFGNYIGILGGWAVCRFALDFNTAGYILRALESAEHLGFVFGNDQERSLRLDRHHDRVQRGANCRRWRRRRRAGHHDIGRASFARNVSHERGAHGHFLFCRMKANGKPMIEVDAPCSKIWRSRRAQRHLIQCPSRRYARYHGRQRLRQEHVTAAYDWLHEADFGNGETVWRRNHRDEGARDPAHPVAIRNVVPIRCVARLADSGRERSAATFAAHRQIR